MIEPKEFDMVVEIQAEIQALLIFYAEDEHGRNSLATRIAAAALEMNHLYEDLGLPSRAHMNHLMKKHYPALAAMKPETVRWKKFLFDTVGSVAPACVACGDQTRCFSCDLELIKS